MRERLTLAARAFCTLWFAFSLAVSCAGVCVFNLVARGLLFLTVKLRHGDRAYQSSLDRWGPAIMAGGAYNLCLMMYPIWRVEVVDNVPAVKCRAPEPNRKEADKVPKSSTGSAGPPPLRIINSCPRVSLPGMFFRQVFEQSVLNLKHKFPPQEANGCIIMCNHLGNPDGFVLRATTYGWLSGCKMIYKAALDKIPLFGWAFRLTRDLAVQFVSSKMNDFAVMKGTVGPMMADSSKHLASGRSIALFPEGVRSPDGEIKPFRDGFFRLAVEQNVNIFPIAIVGSRKAWVPKEAFVNFSDIYVIRGAEAISPKGKTVEQLKAEVVEHIETMKRNFLDFEELRGNKIAI